ncbi:MAG TPA: hypothetical protein VIJ61_11895 [Thermoanaerobaculia bacterium]
MAEDPLELIHPMKDVFLLGIEVWRLEEHREYIWFSTDFRADIICQKGGLQLL